MPEGIPPDAVCIVDRITPELIQDEIKKTIRHLDISASDFNINLIRGWEKEYDTNIDETNIHMFIYDRFNDPVNFLKSRFLKPINKKITISNKMATGMLL